MFDTLKPIHRSEETLNQKRRHFTLTIIKDGVTVLLIYSMIMYASHILSWVVYDLRVIWTRSIFFAGTGLRGLSTCQVESRY